MLTRLPRRICQKSLRYGVSQDMPDPVARSMRRCLITCTPDERIERMCSTLRKLDAAGRDGQPRPCVMKISADILDETTQAAQGLANTAPSQKPTPRRLRQPPPVRSKPLLIQRLNHHLTQQLTQPLIQRHRAIVDQSTQDFHNGAICRKCAEVQRRGAGHALLKGRYAVTAMLDLAINTPARPAWGIFQRQEISLIS